MKYTSPYLAVIDKYDNEAILTQLGKLGARIIGYAECPDSLCLHLVFPDTVLFDQIPDVCSREQCATHSLFDSHGIGYIAWHRSCPY